MIIEPVFGDLGELTSFELVGTCGDAIIVQHRNQRRALDRGTGAAIDVPAELDPIPPAGELVGVELRHRDLVRVHADWIEQIDKLSAKSQLLVIDSLAIAISRGGEAIGIKILETSGPVVNLSLPRWLGTRAVALDGPRVLAFISPSRISWLSYATIAELYRRAPQLAGGGVVRVIPPGSSRGDGFVTVTRGGRTNAVVEGSNGARIFLTPQYAEVSKGDRLEIRLAGGGLALFDARDRMVAKQDSIAMVRTVETTTTDAPHETQVRLVVSPGAIARSKIGPGVLTRLDRLHELGLAPDRPAIDAAITAAFGGAEVEIRQPAIAAARLLYEHYRKVPDETRALVGKDAIARAPRDGWELVMMADYQPFAIRLDDRQRSAIVDEDLLLLEPLPAVVSPPGSADEVRAQLLALIQAAPDEVVLEPRSGGRFALKLSIRAAALLDQRAGYSR